MGAHESHIQCQCAKGAHLGWRMRLVKPRPSKSVNCLCFCLLGLPQTRSTLSAPECPPLPAGPRPRRRRGGPKDRNISHLSAAAPSRRGATFIRTPRLAEPSAVIGSIVAFCIARRQLSSSCRRRLHATLARVLYDWTAESQRGAQRRSVLSDPPQPRGRGRRGRREPRFLGSRAVLLRMRTRSPDRRLGAHPHRWLLQPEEEHTHHAWARMARSLPRPLPALPRSTSDGRPWDVATTIEPILMDTMSLRDTVPLWHTTRQRMYHSLYSAAV